MDAQFVQGTKATGHDRVGLKSGWARNWEGSCCLFLVQAKALAGPPGRELRSGVHG